MAPNYKMKTIVVGLVKAIAFMLCNYGAHSRHYSCGLRRNMPGSYDPAQVCLAHESLLLLPTSGLADHDVAVFTLSPVVKALHLDVIRGLRLEVSNHVPVFHAWERQTEKGEGEEGWWGDKGEKPLPPGVGVDTQRSRS